MSSDHPRFVFVIGTGRCGSTMVEEVLARHPAVGFISNIDDRLAFLGLRGRWNAELYRRLPPSFTTKGRLRFAPSEGYRLLDREVSPLITTPFRDLRADDATPWLEQRSRECFESRARTQRKETFLHKFTGWPRARFIDRVFPGALFIHVVRDGRSVANSLLQMPWWSGHRGLEQWSFGPLPERYAEEWEQAGRSATLLAGICWKLLIDAFEEARAAIHPERWLECRYEDVCADPRAELGGMLRFAGLDWDERFESGFRRHRFARDRVDAFRRDLDAAAVKMLEQSLATHLHRFGYHTSTAHEAAELEGRGWISN